MMLGSSLLAAVFDDAANALEKLGTARANANPIIHPMFILRIESPPSGPPGAVDGTLSDRCDQAMTASSVRLSPRLSTQAIWTLSPSIRNSVT